MQAEIGMRLGFREMDTLGTLLKAMAKSPPLDFTYTGQIFFGFNPETDMVYLYNENYETVILEEGKAVRTYWFESVQYEYTAEGAFEDICSNSDPWSIEDIQTVLRNYNYTHHKECIRYLEKLIDEKMEEY